MSVDCVPDFAREVEEADTCWAAWLVGIPSCLVRFFFLVRRSLACVAGRWSEKFVVGNDLNHEIC